jgi:DNA-directed RNA polymerase specialized sigma24 family protein
MSMDKARSTHHKEASPAGTLGAVLYAGGAGNLVPEAAWVLLIQKIAAGDVRALRALVEASYRIVFTLAARITTNRHAAEEVTVNLFHDVWRCAREYDAGSATVVAWIMNRVRPRAYQQRLQLDMQGSTARWSRPAAAPEAVDALSSDLVPSERLWWRLEQRIGVKDASGLPSARTWAEPDWEEVAPGISCKLLANDLDHHRVSMLVRLAPGGEYPPHRHAGLEELHLLHGELWIDDRKLVPGDYNRALPGSSDKRVWSETGCTCVLITSTRDDLSAPEPQPQAG